MEAIHVGSYVVHSDKVDTHGQHDILEIMAVTREGN